MVVSVLNPISRGQFTKPGAQNLSWPPQLNRSQHATESAPGLAPVLVAAGGILTGTFTVAP